MSKPAERYLVPKFRQKFEIPESSYSILRSQFPLQLAYAVTTHRVRGMTVQKAIVELNERFFASGQLYVALCHIRRLDILGFYKQLLEFCDYVDAIRPTPPTVTVPYPDRADDTSDASLPIGESQADKFLEHKPLTASPTTRPASRKQA